jgi:hypothetical protein
MSAAELMVVTGCETAGAAALRWKAFLRHCTLGAKALGGYPPITAEALGRHWRVTIRNLAKKQGFASSNEQERSDTEQRAQNAEQIAFTTPSTYKWQRPEGPGREALWRERWRGAGRVALIRAGSYVCAGGWE